MLAGKQSLTNICRSHTFTKNALSTKQFDRCFVQSVTLPQRSIDTSQPEHANPKHVKETVKDEGRMSDRLEQMTEEMLQHGGRRAEKIVKEAGFSEELKAKLEARLMDSKFRSENPAAFAQVTMPASLFQCYRRATY